jgi:hypothetical protein
MKYGKILSIALVTGLIAGNAHDAGAQVVSRNINANEKGDTVTKLATGPFEVKLNPLQPYNNAEDSKLARMSIDKQFHGDLEATSKGEMLSAGTDTKGSAGYVAIERVTGALHGRHGSFVLQHNATMTRGTPYLNIIVAPDSGSGELLGLSGNMRIIIAEGKHSYEFEYVLPEQP